MARNKMAELGQYRRAEAARILFENRRLGGFISVCADLLKIIASPGRSAALAGSQRWPAGGFPQDDAAPTRSGNARTSSEVRAPLFQTWTSLRTWSI